MAAGRAAVPKTCWVNRSSSRNGSMRMSMAVPPCRCRCLHAHKIYIPRQRLSDKTRLRFSHGAYWRKPVCITVRPRKGDVMVTGSGGEEGRSRDLYLLLGVARETSGEEITLAWRRRARDEHPDARHGDDGAPARFRALAEAWQVLGDPGRRAAYDRGLDPGQHPGRVRITVRHSPTSPGSRTGRAAPHQQAGPPARRWRQGRCGSKAAPARRYGREPGMRRTCGWRCWRSCCCATAGPAVVSPGVGVTRPPPPPGRSP